MAAPVVTRFAPSPTGYLHIGGARTALFNWAFSRHTGGKMLLRIEDTDRERSTEGAVKAIFDGLKWLGLDWDGEPFMQFSRAARHAEVANELLARGQAYYCYCSPEELAEMRETARANGLPPRYNGYWRDRDPSEAPAGVAPVIRIKAPLSGEIRVNDHVQGEVVFRTENLDDFIILRSDGTPTYNFAVVVDDHDMGITHVIRGVDHLTNAARQTQVYLALDWDVPVFAHVPLIHGPDGAKLSKRHGAEATDAYRAMGYLPEAMRNYLVRLGWSHGDDEIMATEQLIEWFNLEAIGRSPARFDFAKLGDLNGHYIRKADDETLVGRIRDYLHVAEGGAQKLARLDRDGGWDQLRIALPGLKERAKTLVELVESSAFLFADRPLTLDDKAAKLIDADAQAMLAGLIPRFEAAGTWTAAGLEAEVRAFAEATGAKLGKVAQPLRAALTGRSVSPPVFDVMHALGRAETIARLKDQAR